MIGVHVGISRVLFAVRHRWTIPLCFGIIAVYATAPPFVYPSIPISPSCLTIIPMLLQNISAVAASFP